jgi:amino acid transporter
MYTSGANEARGIQGSVPVTQEIPGMVPKSTDYGLRRADLSPLETLAQSISAFCPTLTPFVTLPLVYALAGNATWVAYVLATGGTLLVAWCVSRFARCSASPGGIYSYAATSLPPWLAALCAWCIVMGSVAGSSSNIGGFYYFANAMLRNTTGHEFSVLLLAAIIGIPPILMAWLDVKISARLMLSIETVSVTLVMIVIALVLFRHGLHGDPNQLQFQGLKVGGFRQGLVFAMYSFLGFESATALGAEARNPLKTIPRAVIQTALLGGVFFTLCAYTEVLGFDMVGKNLGTSDVPMHVLSQVAGIPAFGFLIDLGALVSLFAGILAGIIAGARILLQMAHNGLAPGVFAATHSRYHTPTVATIAAGLAAFLPAIFLAVRGASGLDVYGWIGMMAVYGTIISYGLVCVALPGYLREHYGVVNTATKLIPWLGCTVMVFALAANLYPTPEGLYGKLPYVFLAYLAVVLLLFSLRTRPKIPIRDES